ncbi:flagellin [Prosthecomicrobium hirschii]|uniref:flagellin N-terminal helical domain-containing protein n=1 Tax=Prosthecodimorpha hirschii TaxID=665126 RepID=UPI00221F6AE1|nr:flagellin [Prosthecomicrobium hirschii]MCW1843964.1 flagellin [Prosthecomicrobium hirschii]
MSDIVLSKGIRSNLMQLQNTAANVALTQGRLATGKKVNSALDNPANFFTSQSLSSRANDLSNLLDGLSNGIKVLEAADNGLKAITKTVESLQSTVLQARQDKSNKTESFTLDATAIGTSSVKNISFSGGAVGSTAVNVALNATSSAAVQSTVAGSAAYQAPTAGSAATSGGVTASGTFASITLGASDTLKFNVSVDGSAQALTFTKAEVDTALGGSTGTIGSVDDLATVINSKLTGATASNSSGDLRLTSSSTGTSSNVSVTSVAINDGSSDTATNSTGFDGTAGQAGTAGAAAVAAVDRVISISDGTNTANITLTSANAGDAATAATYINSQLTSAGITGTVSNSSGTLTLAGASNGTNSLTVSGAGASAVFGASATTTAGTAAVTGAVKSVDELVTAINGNSSLTGKIKASNDNGKLRIENISTSDLTVTGANSSGSVTGSGSVTNTIGANEVRKNLVTQFNDLRGQLDKLSDDASFNGVNLLKGDKLKLNFNENSTSTLEIQAKDSAGAVREITNAKLGVTAATNAEFESDASLDSRVESLRSSLDTIRSQSSSFGSNLSIVQNRQDFTKNMINTLQTGSDNLVLADANEEAANLLSLQTRQQLSQTALSLASQADQGVLRLF